MATNATNHHQINLDKHTLLSVCFPDCLFKGKSVTHEHLSTSPPSQVSASVFGVFSVCYSLVIIIVFGVCYLLFIVSQYSVLPLPLSVSAHPSLEAFSCLKLLLKLKLKLYFVFP